MKNSGKIVLYLIIIVSLAAGIYLFTGRDGLFMKRVYRSEVEAELGKTDYNNQYFTKGDIAILPEPVQRYFNYCGYIGKKKMSTAKIIFEDVDFLNGDKRLILRSEQYNFVSEPARIVYLSSKIMGIIPFEGRDKFQNGQGFMTGKLMKLIPLFDVTGPEMNQSALVTFLAEVLVVPNSALQDYIHWEEIDSNRVKAIMEYNDMKVEGIFTINDKGEFIKFETEDRYMDKGNGIFEKEKWTAEIDGYTERDGIMFPDRMRGIWNLAEGDLVYFDGKISDVNFDLSEI